MEDYFADVPKECRPSCKDCPFAEDGKPKHIPVRGIVCEDLPKNAIEQVPNAVLVGEGPGHEEVRKGIPFKGKTGKELDNDLRNSKIDRRRLAIFNAMACLPPKVKTDGMLGKATKACQPFFNWQWKPYKHLPVLAMGKWAGAAINSGHAIGVDKGRGFVRMVGTTNMILTYHPTYAHFYNPWKLGEFINDMQRFYRMIHGLLAAAPKIYIQPNFTYGLLKSLLEQRHFMPLASDIETKPAPGMPPESALNPLLATLKTISVGWPDIGFGYLWNSNLKIQRLIISYLQDDTILKVFHNGWFYDLRVLGREPYNVHVKNVVDTRDARRAVSATSKLSLLNLTSTHTDFEPWKENDDEK